MFHQVPLVGDGRYWGISIVAVNVIALGFIVNCVILDCFNPVLHCSQPGYAGKSNIEILKIK